MQLFFLEDVPTEWEDRHSEMLPVLSVERRERIAHYRFSSDKLLSLYSAVLVRYAIDRAGVLPDSCRPTFSGGINEKPFCNEAAFLDFSISHTHDAVLCGTTSIGKIGVDLEPLRVAPFETMKIVFHDNEIVEISSHNLESDLRFFKMWTRKEAYTKCIGTGLVANLTQIDTTESVINERTITWQEGKYICSVYADKDRFSKISRVSCEELEDYCRSLNKNM